MDLIKTEFPIKGLLDSRIGGRSENQDSYGYGDTPIGTAVIVCDGMGGMRGGQYASALAVRSIMAFLSNVLESADPVDAITNAIRIAHSNIIQTGQNNPELAGMGTTVTALILSKDFATVAHVGDSRVYQLRSRTKHFRTFDHSMVFDMVKNHILTEEQARVSENSNVITKALGAYGGDVTPDVSKLPYLKGDRFVLCTDGLWGSMPEKELVKSLSRARLDIALEGSLDSADSIGKAKGGNHDNLTAAIIEMNIDSKMKEKMSMKTKILISALSVLLISSIGLNVYQYIQAKNQSMATAVEQPKEDSDIAEAEETTEVMAEAAAPEEKTGEEE